MLLSLLELQLRADDSNYFSPVDAGTHHFLVGWMSFAAAAAADVASLLLDHNKTVVQK
jgi:hypothetical protein